MHNQSINEFLPFKKTLDTEIATTTWNNLVLFSKKDAYY